MVQDSLRKMEIVASRFSPLAIAWIHVILTDFSLFNKHYGEETTMANLL